MDQNEYSRLFDRFEARLRYGLGADEVPTMHARHFMLVGFSATGAYFEHMQTKVLLEYTPKTDELHEVDKLPNPHSILRPK